MNDVTGYVVDFLLNVAAFLFALRFLLQLMRADFYNPISQAIVKATDPVLKPLRVIIRGYKNIDFAALLAIALCMGLLHIALATIASAFPGSVWQIGVISLSQALLLLLSIVKWSILISIIASFIAQGNNHPALMLVRELTEPVLAPARNLLPDLGGLDFSPILIFLAIGIIERTLPQLLSALL